MLWTAVKKPLFPPDSRKVARTQAAAAREAFFPEPKRLKARRKRRREFQAAVS
jgi:hypothetical protein